jgi:hypothetical protein
MSTAMSGHGSDVGELGSTPEKPHNE